MFLIGKDTVKAKHWLHSALRKLIIIDWYAEFKRDRTSAYDSERSDRPKWADCKIKLHEIADILKISKGNIFTILQETLIICKLLSE